MKAVKRHFFRKDNDAKATVVQCFQQQPNLPREPSADDSTV
jgi:hypothetical protein